MSTVKITELPEIAALDPNENNTIFVVVDTDTDITGKLTLATLYSNVNSYITANAVSANSVIYTRITANVANLRGEITANAESTNAFANLAFTKANNAIANTNGVITAGDFNISGNGYVTGTFEIDNGIIYLPRILEGSQTAFTIDFSTSSIIKANISDPCTISLSNHQAGKVVEVWILNTSGVNKTVTHGCSAENSTINSTTVTIPGTSSAYLKYFSIHTDNANTFVAIQSA